MKRGADKQLTRDDAEGDEDEVEEVEGAQGFKKADESVLARRPMKGLPRRSLAATGTGATKPTQPPPSTISSTTETQPPPKFSGFGGFGSGSTSTPFSFSAPSIQKSAPSTGPATSAFSPGTSLAPSGTTATSSSLTSGPSVAASASPATKTFASFLNQPSSSSQQASSESVDTSSSEIKEDDAYFEEVKYLLALRGLNESLLSAVSKAINTDPFVDVVELLEQYRKLRISVKTDYDGKVKSIRPTGSDARSKNSAPSTNGSSSGAASSSSSAFMPKPPSSFAGFNPPSALSASSEAKPDEIKNGPSSGFSFGAPSAPAPPKSAFTFGTSSSSSSSNTPFGSGSTAFGSAGGSSSKTTLSPSAFASSPDKSGDVSTSTSASSVFTFGGSSSSAFSPLVFGKPAEKDKDNNASTSSAGTASVSGTSLFGGSAFATPEKPPSSGLAFGSGSPGKPSLFGGLGGVGSLGNPVGFGFGSPPKTPDGETTTNTATSSGFSFSPQKAESSSTSAAGGGSSEETSAPNAIGEAQPQLISTSIYDKEGEGEENEVTTHEIRSKVFKMMNKDGKNEWSDLGIGMLRLKKHKETDSRRMLLRNSSTGKIVINFILYSGMNATVSRNVVSFVGHDGGASTAYRIRTKTEEQANALKSALDREIEFTHAKYETS